jgi:hypothetical protein
VSARLDQLYPQSHVFDVAPHADGGVEIRLDLPWHSSFQAAGAAAAGSAAATGAAGGSAGASASRRTR